MTQMLHAHCYKLLIHVRLQVRTSYSETLRMTISTLRPLHSLQHNAVFHLMSPPAPLIVRLSCVHGVPATLFSTAPLYTYKEMRQTASSTQPHSLSD